jgi:uncharacterized protein YeaO (DUF488 family)
LWRRSLSRFAYEGPLHSPTDGPRLVNNGRSGAFNELSGNAEWPVPDDGVPAAHADRNGKTLKAAMHDMNITTKRVYDEPDPQDGKRILVDRLWPRGLSKEKANVDAWLKAVAPSNELRKWYQHDPQKWAAFKKRYFAELDANEEAVNELIDHVNAEKVTFLYSTKETQYNNAVALKEYVEA